MKPCGGLFGGGSKSSSATTTTNTDNRTAVQDGVAIAGSSGTFNVNSSDAVKAIAQMGSDTIAATGEAVVQLNQAGLEANVTAWDKTLQRGADLVDKLIDSTTQIGTSAITNFQPAENKASETSLKLGMIAAAAVAASVLLSRMPSR